MARDGADLAGEARLIDAMVARGSGILDAGCGSGRVMPGVLVQLTSLVYPPKTLKNSDNQCRRRSAISWRFRRWMPVPING
jgi:hypothetical protein